MRLPLAVLVAASTLFLAAPAHGAATSPEARMAREIADDINAERAARGLSRIPMDGSWSAGAQRVAESNRDRDCRTCHSSDHLGGEVVYWGSNHASGGATSWWMNSPPHRALLVARDAVRIGVGVACSGTAYYAAAWIDTDGAGSAPASPVVTSAGSGSRCPSQGQTATTAPPTTVRAARAAAPTTTTTRPTRATATTRSASATTRAGRTANTRRTTTTSVARRVATASRPPPKSDSQAVIPTAAGAADIQEFGLAATTRTGATAATSAGWVGDRAALTLLGCFVGVFALGVVSRRQSSRR